MSLGLKHPLTGKPWGPIGYRRNGCPIWPVLGASGTPPEPPEKDDSDDDDEEDTDAGGAGDGEEDTDEDDKSGQGADDDETDEDKAQSAKDRELARENARRRSENKTLKAELQKTQEQLRKYADKDKSELQRATDRVTELETENGSLTEKVKALTIRNAFLSANTYTWHDPDDALSLADLSEVTIDDDGEVDKDALKAALTKLAKAKPHLVKSGTSGPSGDPNAGRKRSSDKDAKSRRAQIAKRFPSTFAR